MKKQVEVTVLLVLVAFLLFFSHGVKTITGMQAAFELPEPPPVPGFEEQVPPPPVQPVVQQPAIIPPPRNVTRNVTRPRVEMPVAVPDTGLETRVATLEKTVAGLQQQFSRVDTLESQVQGLNTDAENMRRFMSRPVVDQPAFLEGLAGLGGAIRRVSNTVILSISLSVFVLLLVIGLIATAILQRRKETEEEKKLVKQYLQNYSRQGYKLETLKMHLQASGWSEDVINEAMRELQRR